MASTFLNISTDNTLGGNGASDSLIPSQAAVKHYADTKQTALVSGNNIKTVNGESLLGSGNITIESSSTPNVDGTTVSYDSNSALQAIAVKNKNGNVVLPIWQGTEQEWNQGVATTWYNWQTEMIMNWSAGGALPSTGPWGIAFGDNQSAAAVKTDDNTTTEAAYSTDGGTTWTASTLPSSLKWTSIAYGNNTFVAVSKGTSQLNSGKTNVCAYSTDGGKTWQSSTLPTKSRWYLVLFGGNKFVAFAEDGSTAYSTNNGLTWTTGGTLPGNDSTLLVGIYGGDRFVIINTGYDYYVYSTDGITWNGPAYFPNSSAFNRIAYGNGTFVVIGSSLSYSAYSTDGALTWTTVNYPSEWSSGAKNVAYGDNKFVAISDGTLLYYSESGTSWNYAFTSTNLSGSTPFIYNNGNFFSIIDDGNENQLKVLSFSSASSCYTQTSEPSTTSIVYSAPETASQLTIISVDSTNNTITLSDSQTYSYNSSGNSFTYSTIGAAHPNYLCFINGVGVKIGNTLIAEYTDTASFQSTSNLVTSVSSSSTDSQYPSAKLFYDTVGDVETLINAL